MNSRFNFLPSLSIRQRIGFGFSCMLVLLVLLAGGAWYVLSISVIA